MAIEVNGELIAADEIRAEMNRLQRQEGANLDALTVDERVQLRTMAVESLIDRMLLFQEAQRLGIMPKNKEVLETAAKFAPRMDGVSGCRAGTDVPQLTKDVERQLVVDRLADYWRRNTTPPRYSEIKDYYRKNRDQFWSAEQISAAHVVRYVEGRNKVDEKLAVEWMRDRLISSEPLADVAGSGSDCPENGGDLGYFPRGVMVEEFDAVVFSAPLHEWTPVFETRFGFHVALVRDRRDEGIRPLSEVAASISEVLTRRKLDKEIGNRFSKLRNEARIKRSAT